MKEKKNSKITSKTPGTMRVFLVELNAENKSATTLVCVQFWGVGFLCPFFGTTIERLLPDKNVCWDCRPFVFIPGPCPSKSPKWDVLICNTHHLHVLQPCALGDGDLRLGFAVFHLWNWSRREWTSLHVPGADVGTPQQGYEKTRRTHYRNLFTICWPHRKEIRLASAETGWITKESNLHQSWCSAQKARSHKTPRTWIFRILKHLYNRRNSSFDLEPTWP